MPGFPPPFDGDTVHLAADARTDWFIHPGTGEIRLNAPALLAPVSGDFLFSAYVEVGFGATFDAGVLVLRHDDRTWAKLCFEYSPDGEPMVVSVVTRGVSDDCNSFVVDGNAVWLRAARIGPALAFHASLDGVQWRLVRHFRLADDLALEAGFLVQSPTGEGCRATFAHVALEEATLHDLRDGT
jgi:regulation of enolase protein 1 (concanavalin A-like superfamily)